MISGSINGVKTGSFVVLVMLKTAYTETFHVLQFESKYLKVKLRLILAILAQFFGGTFQRHLVVL